VPEMMAPERPSSSAPMIAKTKAGVLKRWARWFCYPLCRSVILYRRHFQTSLCLSCALILRFGRKVLIDRQDLDDWIEKHKEIGVF